MKRALLTLAFLLGLAAPASAAPFIVNTPADAGPYLEAVDEGESQLTRLSRHEAFWRAWLAANHDTARFSAH